ncbi:MAG: hypothetical protein ACFFDR_08990 [Candidatus Thorarchaeota archaeon]
MFAPKKPVPVRDCPFREGSCITRECMLWIGGDFIGQCSFVKSYRVLDQRLPCITGMLAILLIMVAIIIWMMIIV